MKKYVIIETGEEISEDTYCDVLREYRRITGDQRTFEEFVREHPEFFATFIDQNGDATEELKCLFILQVLSLLLRIIREI